MKFLRILLPLSAAFLVSCSTSKSLTYMQDLVPGETFAVAEEPEITIRPGDRLRIAVSCKTPQLAQPFNKVETVFALKENAEGTANTEENVKSSGWNRYHDGYLVEPDGQIDFPVLGMVKVQDMTLSAIEKMLEEKISAYIKEPKVRADILNFQYTILGEVSKRGNKTVEGNRINLIQAIAAAEDLTTSANYKEVFVIRTRPGSREVYAVDMKSKELYNSPAFYLQQDDVIYVKPRGSKWNSDANLALSLSMSALSALSIITNIIMWVYAYGR